MPVDIVIPCATQNELDVEDAVMIVANNVRYYVEAANMPATAEALRLLRLSPKILTAGSKASGSGGVVVSALEMVQNSLRYSWTRQEVDSRLKQIMGGIYDASAAAAEEYGLGYDLIAGNDIAAFKKISTAMIAPGTVILPLFKTHKAARPSGRPLVPINFLCSGTGGPADAGPPGFVSRPTASRTAR